MTGNEFELINLSFKETSENINLSFKDTVFMDDGSYSEGYEDGYAEGIRKTPSEERTLDISEKGTYTVERSADKYISKVTVNANYDKILPMQEKSVTITENGSYEVVPDDGYALSKVGVTVNVGGDDNQIIKGLKAKDISDYNSSDNFTALIDGSAIDWTNFNTKKHSSFGSFFRYYGGKELNLAGLDTSNSSNFYYMFGDCTKITSLDVSGFNTSKVTNMGGMFCQCNSLTSLDLSSFDTSKVTTLSNTFRNCNSLQTLDLSNFDTSNVKNMGEMFYYSVSFHTLDLSSFDTSQVTNMNNMFCGCSSLQTLNLSSFDTSAVTTMVSMLSGCAKLENVTFGNNWVSHTNITSFDARNSPLSKASILDLANKIADKSDTSVYTKTYTVTLKTSQKSLFTSDELTALAGQFTAKNWTLAWG